MNGREEMDYKNEQWIKEKIKTCPKILGDYIDSIGESKTSWSRRNYLGYLIQFVNYLKDNGYNVDNMETYNQMKPLDINKYMNYISYRYVNGKKVKNKAGIKAAKLFAVSDFFKFLMENDLVKSNPCEKVKTPKDNIEKEVVALTPDEIKIVRDNITNRDKGRCKKYVNRDLCIFLLGVTTGLRVSAIVGINVSDIDFENHKITVTEKRKKTYDVIIGEKTLQALKTWIEERKQLLSGYEDTDALFISKNKSRMSTVSVRKMLSKDTYNIDKHITPHKMRSTCGVNLYEATGDILLVKDQLHHQNVETTKIYVGVSNARRAMATEKLNNII